MVFAGGAVRRSNAVGLDLAQYDSLARFRSALRRFLAFSEAATREAGVTPSQYQALLVIKTHPVRAIMVRELAQEMLLKPNGAVQLVDRLSAAGLVVRRESVTDRRSVLVALTARGGALLERLAAAHISELLKQEPLLAESLRRLRQIDH
jgi:DNA-binding MarR family transcriptional regulator